MKLAELQNRIQRDVLDGTEKSLPMIKVPKGTQAGERLNVYQNAYKMRLIGIVGETREYLWTYMGDEAFYEMANRYFDAYPSKHPNARFVAGKLGRFLREDSNYSKLPILAELAEFEGALEDVFDAPNQPIVVMDDLAKLPPEHIATLTLEFAPSIRWLDQRTNSIQIYEALKKEETPPSVAQLELDPQGDDLGIEPSQTVVVWRVDMMSRYREMGPEEAMLLKEAVAGKNFGELCEMAAVMADPDTAAARVAGVLSEWINGQMLCGLIMPSNED